MLQSGFKDLLLHVLLFLLLPLLAAVVLMQVSMLDAGLIC